MPDASKLENKQVSISIGSVIRLCVSIKNLEQYPIDASWHLRVYKTDFQGSNGVLIPDTCLDSYILSSGILNSHLSTYEPFASNLPQNFEMHIEPANVHFKLDPQMNFETGSAIHTIDGMHISKLELAI